MKIITISREFGSGGRELGKRLADALGFDYYDREIITAIAENSGMDEGYVTKMLEEHGWRDVPLTFRHSFTPALSPHTVRTDLLLEQTKVIREIAKAGKDCVIVGRNADVLLREYRPFNLFVCADMEAKIRRCQERGAPDEKLTLKELERKIRSIDKNRARTRDIITGSRWGERGSYHLIVNTTGWEIKELTPAAAEFAVRWFGREDQH